MKMRILPIDIIITVSTCEIMKWFPIIFIYFSYITLYPHCYTLSGWWLYDHLTVDHSVPNCLEILAVSATVLLRFEAYYLYIISLRQPDTMWVVERHANQVVDRHTIQNSF